MYIQHNSRTNILCALENVHMQGEKNRWVINNVHIKSPKRTYQEPIQGSAHTPHNTYMFTCMYQFDSSNVFWWLASTYTYIPNVHAQVLRAPRAKRACRAGPAQQGLREIRVWRAAQVQRDHAVPRGRMARRVSLDLQVPAGQQVQLGQRDLLDCRVLSVQRARWERLVFRADTLSVRLDFPDSLASQEATARWASLVFPARVVLRECLASREHRDLQGSTGLLAQHRTAQMPRWVCRSVVWEISFRHRTFGTEVAPPTRTTRQARKPACLQQAGATRLGRRLVPSRRPSTCAVPGVVTFSVTKIRFFLSRPLSLSLSHTYAHMHACNHLPYVCLYMYTYAYIYTFIYIYICIS